MSYILNSLFNRKLLTIIVLVTFLLTPLHSQHLQHQSANINEVMLIAKLEKLIKKLLSYENKNKTSSMIDALIDIKKEIEHVTNSHIHLTPIFNQIENDLKQNGYSIPAHQFDKFKKRIKKHDRKTDYRLCEISQNLDNPDLFDLKKERYEYEDDLDELPPRVNFGITVALAGCFLVLLPMPWAKSTGYHLITAGIAFAIDGGFSENEENKK